MFLRDSPPLCSGTRQYVEIMNDSDHKQQKHKQKTKKTNSTFFIVPVKKINWCLAYAD